MDVVSRVRESEGGLVRGRWREREWGRVSERQVERERGGGLVRGRWREG